jgi:hypothetical protein
MSNYERGLSGARATAVSVPEFEAIAADSERDRQAWIDEGREARVRARRWLLLAAVAWMAGPPLWELDGLQGGILVNYAVTVPMVVLVLWAARLSQERRLRAAILTRAIAASNLLYAICYSMSGELSFCIVSVLLAVTCSRSLRALGELGLDRSDDLDSSFEPVKFRGILILSLVMACADALVLLFGAMLTGMAVVWAYFFFEGYELWSWLMMLPQLGLTVAAVVLMTVNVWGLLRLRTWALLSNILSTVAIAALNLSGMLVTEASYLSIALVVTAGIQLLLPLPILAAALGWRETSHVERVGALLLRGVGPVAVLFTLVAAAFHLVSRFG